MGGAALHRAIGMVIAKGTRIAARLLQAEPEQVEFTNGRFALPA